MSTGISKFSRCNRQGRERLLRLCAQAWRIRTMNQCPLLESGNQTASDQDRVTVAAGLAGRIGWSCVRHSTKRLGLSISLKITCSKPYDVVHDGRACRNQPVQSHCLVEADC